MKLTSILALACGFSACVAQPYAERKLADHGVEPGVPCNRSLVPNQHRVVVHFDSSLSDPDGRRMKRVVSFDRGDSFDAPPAYVHQDGNLQADPAIAANTPTGGVDAGVQSKRTGQARKLL